MCGSARKPRTEEKPLKMADFARTIINMVQAQQDLTARQIAVLLILHKERKTEKRRYTKALAELLRLNKPSVTRAVDKLTDQVKPLVERSTPDSDRRQCIVTLTDAGMAYVARIQAGFDDARAVQ